MKKQIQELIKRDQFIFNDTIYTVRKKYRNDDSPLLSECGQMFHNEELEVEYIGKANQLTIPSK